MRQACQIRRMDACRTATCRCVGPFTASTRPRLVRRNDSCMPATPRREEQKKEGHGGMAMEGLACLPAAFSGIEPKNSGFLLPFFRERHDGCSTCRAQGTDFFFLC